MRVSPMLKPSSCFALALVAPLLLAQHAHADGDTAPQIIEKVLEADPWGLSGAVVSARATVRDAGGATKDLAFHGESRRYDGPLSKSLVRVTAPPDLAGVGLLQIQKRSGDDERFLFLPDLARARRIAGSARRGAFVGTDFSYADIDRRDLRQSSARLVGEEKLGAYDTFHLDVTPTGADAQYARIEIWVRKDGYLPLKSIMYAASGAVVKTLVTEEVRRIGGRWFITRSKMESTQDRRSTELVLDAVAPSDTIPDDEFSVRNLEKL
jgi:hypothetical protein